MDELWLSLCEEVVGSGSAQEGDWMGSSADGFFLEKHYDQQLSYGFASKGSL